MSGSRPRSRAAWVSASREPAPAAAARAWARWITGPSMFGSRAGMPISIRSPPAPAQRVEHQIGRRGVRIAGDREGGEARTPGPGQQVEAALEPFAHHAASSGRSRKCSRASGLASASRFLTGRPCTISRTASSTILPLLVRGISGTAAMRAGTWRGEAPARMQARIFFSRRLGQVVPRPQDDEQNDPGCRCPSPGRRRWPPGSPRAARPGGRFPPCRCAPRRS